MPKQFKVRPPYNRVCSTEDTLLDWADKAHKAGELTWKEVQAVQDSLMPDCAHCNLEHGGRILMEGTPLCVVCLPAEFSRRKAARDAA